MTETSYSVDGLILLNQAQTEILETANKSDDPISVLKELLEIITASLGGSVADFNDLKDPKTFAEECFYGGLLPGIEGSCETEKEKKDLILKIADWLKGLIEGETK